MVRIRLTRVGAKKQPYYRVVVADQRSPRDGRFIEIIGNYNPRTDPPTMVVKKDRALFWLRRGAQPSDAVTRILEHSGVMAIMRGEAPEVEEEPVAEAEAPVEAETEIADDEQVDESLEEDVAPEATAEDAEEPAAAEELAAEAEAPAES